MLAKKYPRYPTLPGEVAGRTGDLNAEINRRESQFSRTPAGFVANKHLEATVTTPAVMPAVAPVFPAGLVMMWAGTAAPTGWLLCDGSAVAQVSYPALWVAIGTTYGAVAGCVVLPDFRGVFPKGAGATTRAAGVDASGNFYAATLGAYSQDQMQGHVHAPPAGVNFTASGGSTPYSINNSAGNISSSAYTGLPATDNTNGTPRTGHTTEPQSLGIAFIIKT